MANIKMGLSMLELALARSGKFLSSISESESARISPERYLQILNDECEREIALINDLLDLQRLEAGVQPLISETIHLSEWLRQLLEPFQVRAQKRQQSLQVNLPADIPPLVCNPPSLGRILAELLNNACKYTPPGEGITLTVCATAERMLLQVSNSGVEIPEHELPRIFDRFYRIPSADPWKQGGTGLGLALVQKLVEHLGGFIRVKSALRQTCFTVELPLSSTN